jgi:hypothetical protein
VLRMALLGGVLAALGVAASYAPAADVASRTFDRTFVCKPVAFGGIGDLDVNVSPLREDPIGRRFVATLEARTGGSGADETLVVARALKQPEHPGLAYNSSAGGAAGVFAHSRRCASARAALPLSARGLAGPPIAWEKWLDCAVRGRVLVRVRAVLQSPDDWGRVDRSYAGVGQPLVEAKLAVRLQRTGKPIAYMELDAKGATKLWYSGNCS